MAEDDVQESRGEHVVLLRGRLQGTALRCVSVRTPRPNRGLIAGKAEHIKAVTAYFGETFLSFKQIGPHRREPSPVTFGGALL